MRVRWIVLAFLAATSSLVWARQTALPSLTAAQVVANCLQANGGAARLGAIRTLVTSGHLERVGSPDAALRMWARPNQIRVEIDLPEGKMVQGYDGAAGWQISPGSTKAVALSGDELRLVQDEATGFPNLMAAGKQLNAVNAEGTGQRGGHDYYALRLQLMDGDVFHLYVDAKTWLPFAEEYPMAEGQIGEEAISDYREVAGVMMPFRFVSGPKGGHTSTLVRETLQVDAPAAAELFQMPPG